MQRVHAIARDKAVFSAADYTCLLKLPHGRLDALIKLPPAAQRATELKREVNAPSSQAAASTLVPTRGHGTGSTRHIRDAILSDLSRLGFEVAADVVHVEVAYDCSREVKQLQRLRALRAEQQELLARELMMRRTSTREGSVARASGRSNSSSGRSSGCGTSPTCTGSPGGWRGDGGAEGRRVRALLRRVDEESDLCRASLAELEHTPHTPTGDVFVIFETQMARNRLLRMWKDSRGRGMWENAHDRWATKTREVELEALNVWHESTITVAPEPSAVQWVNLEFQPNVRRWRTFRTYLATALLITLNAGLIVGVKLIKNLEAFGELSSELQMLITFGSASLTALTNIALKVVIRALTSAERHQTNDQEEVSLMAKLGAAYAMNTIIIPAAVQSFPYLVTQAWYESSGVVAEVISLIIADAAVIFLVAMPAIPIVNRYIRAPLFAKSQLQLSSLWSPHKVSVGWLYASVLKTVGLALIYAPLWPPVYLLSAVACLIHYGCISFALTFWVAAPAQLADQLMHTMRSILAAMILLRSLIELLGATKAQPDQALSFAAAARFALSVLLVTLYAAAPLKRVRCLQGYENDDDTTGAVRYSDVSKLTGQALERYRCPAAYPENGRDAKSLEQRSILEHPSAWQLASQAEAEAENAMATSEAGNAEDSQI